MKKQLIWKYIVSLLLISLITLSCTPAYMTKNITGIRRTVEIKPVKAKKAKPPGELTVLFVPPNIITEEIISNNFFLDGKSVKLTEENPRQGVRELVFKNTPPGKHSLLLKNWTYKYETTRKEVTVESGDETEVVIEPKPTGAGKLVWLPAVFAILGEILWGYVAISSSP